MAITIEALLEENLGKVQELLSAGEAAFEDITAINELGERIEAQFESASSSALTGLQSLQATIAALEASFDQAEQLANGKLVEATGQIQQVQQQATAAVDQVLAVTGAARTQLATAESQLETTLGAADEQLQKLTTEATEFQTSVSDATEKSGQLTEEFEGKVTTALGEIETNKSEVVDEIDSIQTEILQQTDEVVRSIADGTEATQQKLTQSIEAAKTTATGSKEKLNEQLSQSGLQTLSEQLDEVTSAFDIIKNVTESLGLDLGDSVGSVMDDIDEILALVKKIKPVLDLVNELL